MKNKTWIHIPTGQVIVGIPQLTKKGATLVLANGETIAAFYGEHDEYVCDGYDLEDTIEKYNRLIK